MEGENNNQNKLAAIYCRVSSDRQEKEGTIESQVAELEKAVRENGDVLAQRYIDDGYSGAILERPALDKLRDDAQKGLFSRLYIYSPDRLARELMLQLVIVKELRRWGLEINFLSQKFGDSPSDRLLFQMLGAISEFERAQILERTRRGRIYKARKGLVVGPRGPYGYRYIKKTESTAGRYEIHEGEAKNVRLIFRLFNSPQVEGIRTLAKRLHELGIKNDSGTTKWAKSSLSRLITNSTYIGTTYYNKTFACEPLKEDGKKHYKKNRSSRLRPKEEWIPISVPAILSEKEFELAQQKLRRNRELSERNAKYLYLLKGLAFCACSMRMYGYPCHGKPRYKCADKYLKYPLPKTCLQGTVDTQILDNAVWHAFLETLARPEIVVNKIRKMASEKEEQKRSLQAAINRVDKALETLGEQEERFLKAYAEKAITIDQLKAQNKALTLQRSQLLLEKKRLSETYASYSAVFDPETITRYFSRMREAVLGARFEQKRRIIRLFASKVIVQSDSARATVQAYIPAEVSNESLTPVYRDRGVAVPSEASIESLISLNHGRNVAIPLQIEICLTKPEQILIK